MKIREFLIAFDRLVNTLCGGYAGETMSARCWRLRDCQPYKTLRPLIDGLFFWQDRHCETSFDAERNHDYSPQEYR